MPTDAVRTDTLTVAIQEELYLQMARIRAFDSRVLDLYQERLIRGGVHQYIGMEAIAVGACGALDSDDFITSTHRGHGHCIAKGLDLRRVMAEILGRETGYCRGKGGSMHITSIEHGMLGADAIVGGSLALAVGAAYGLRVQGRNSVVVSFFGDGASNQGTFHEAANLASVLDAPVIFICENNQWALSTPVRAVMRIEDVAIRAAGYGFPGVVVDGNDVLEVRAAVEVAAARARKGSGPTLIEAKSYRITTHSAYASADARSPEELETWRQRDPIARFSRYLEEEIGVEPSRLEELTEQARQEIEDAIEFGLASPEPPPSQAVEDVYAPAEWLKPGVLA